MDETGRIRIANERAVLRLSYRAREEGGEWVDINDKIILSKTNPHLGGERFWLICPTCQMRRAILYVGRLFRCRTCYGACYESQLEAPHDRALRHLYKRRQKYGGFGGSYEPFPAKPKRMRWATYQKLLANDDEAMAIVERWSLKFINRL